MPPIKADAAFVWRQFIDLGRSNSKKSKRYRCRRCQKDFAATSVGRPKEHLATCDKWQAKQRQERQARDNAGYLPSYSEAVQKKITEVGVQHISQDESRSFAYDAAAAVSPMMPPPLRAVITRILPEFYQEIHDEVFKRIASSQWFNIIFDASDNVSGHRIVSISVQVPDGPAFYWKTLDAGDEQHTAENWARLIWGETQQLCGGDLSIINSICTDTENTMRSVHDLLGRSPELSHVNFSLCDSHGLQLLIKDILLLPFFEDLFNNVSTLLVFFSRSKLQLQRLRMCQRTRWNGVTRALIRSIITRWGSQYNSFFSLLRSRDPSDLAYYAAWFRQEWVLQARKEKQMWFDNAKSAVKQLWETEYKGRYAVEMLPPPVRKERYPDPAFDRQREHKRIRIDAPVSAADLYEQYISTDRLHDDEAGCDEAIAYWLSRYDSQRDLARFALDLFAISPMSDECERLFSSAKLTIVDRRGRLKADIIEACECLRAWYGKPRVEENNDSEDSGNDDDWVTS
ncbi:hypothetical protein FPOA_13171 [Fusarium poae]|uniref:HAT C-terminal dimerisation domain-containing protein n=1 Tax=Fusarium poae TaxID=36050 RepID=A0A1B8A6I3_FUSPO|nr:hypothetical protein FPOA_13171 [Fusarium poae]